MKFIKFFIVLIILGGIFYAVSPFIPPIVSVKNLTPTHGFGEPLKLDVTITNYTPQPKTFNLPSSEIKGSILVYFDAKDPIESGTVSNNLAFSTYTLAPFAHQTYTIEYALSQSALDEPQRLSGDASSVSLKPGKHTYVVSFGGYLSGEQSFYVQ